MLLLSQIRFQVEITQSLSRDIIKGAKKKKKTGIGHSDPDWIEKAIKRPGSLKSKIKDLGLSDLEMDRQNIKKPGRIRLRKR